MSGWNLQSSPNNEWFGVCNGNSKYVAVGTDNVMTSSDSTLWTNVTDVPSGKWKSVCAKTNTDELGVFVAVGGDVSGAMVSVDNASTWFRATIVPEGTWNSVCHGDKFVAVGNNGIMTSLNGNEWNNVPDVPVAGTWNSVCTGLVDSVNRYVAVGDTSGSNSIIWSDDGNAWNDVSGVTGNSWTSVCYGLPSIGFIAVSNDTAVSSADGKNWTKMDGFIIGIWYSICYGVDGYAVVGSSNGNVNQGVQTYLNDENVWTTRSTAIPSGDWRSVCWGNEFVAVSNVQSNNMGNVMTSSDGKCFLKGTGILCLVNGVKTYVPIENIKLGDLIKTYKHGYKPVKLVKYSKMTNNPYNTYSCLYKHTDSKLIVTGRHLVLLDNDKISKKNIYIETKKYSFNDKIKCIRDFIEDNKFYWFGNSKIDNKNTIHACNLDSFEKVKTTKTYEIYHLVLGSGKRRYGIYSEGVLTASNV